MEGTINPGLGSEPADVAITFEGGSGSLNPS